MRRKRLQHVADTICHMFCGWRLINCKRQLVELGSGTILVDVLTGRCSFDGKPIPQLSIAGELQAWLLEDLETHNIPLDALTRATVEAGLSFTEIPWRARTKNEHFFDDGRTVRTDSMNRCLINCESEVATDEIVYRSRFEDVEEWPVGWPAA